MEKYQAPNAAYSESLIMNSGRLPQPAGIKAPISKKKRKWQAHMNLPLSTGNHVLFF
jgi:hypothetical protein